MKLRRGKLIGYDGFKHKKCSKIHVAIDESSIPLIIGPGDEHDSKKLIEGLEEEPRELYADSAYDIGRYKETSRIRGES